MIKIIKEEIEIDESLVSRLNAICDFCNTTFRIENGVYSDCANDKINTTNINGKLISRILTSISQQEIERTCERTKKPLAGTIKVGHVPHQALLVINMKIKNLL